jgi:hypothetical protein
MTIEELEQQRDEIASRARVRRSIGDITGAEVDEFTAERLTRLLAERKRLRARATGGVEPSNSGES